jgi:hypothetical protein
MYIFSSSKSILTVNNITLKSLTHNSILTGMGSKGDSVTAGVSSFLEEIPLF